MKILSWNVNGLRAVIAKGGMEVLARERPDLLCLQEVKARQDQVGQVLSDMPHQYFASVKKPGYSGTAILCRREPLSWTEGIGRRTSDEEGRVVAVELPSLYVLSVYVPNSQRGLPRLGYRLRWDSQFRSHVAELASRKPVVFCGDLNVAHEEIDIARPRENRMNAGFTDQERASFSRLLAAGFVDTFRSRHDGEAGRYTWWSYASQARRKNVGWRIDYVCISEALRPRLKNAFILGSVEGSDHCPVGVELEGEE